MVVEGEVGAIQTEAAPFIHDEVVGLPRDVPCGHDFALDFERQRPVRLDHEQRIAVDADRQVWFRDGYPREPFTLVRDLNAFEWCAGVQRGDGAQMPDPL